MTEASVPITRRILGDAARAFIREQLSWGGPLSALLASRELDQGSVWAYLPTNVDEARANDFTSAGLFRVPESSRVLLPGGGFMIPVPTHLLGHLTSLVDAFLANRADRLCVLEDPFALPEDPDPASRQDVSYFWAGRTLYYFASSTDALLQTTVDALRMPPSIKYVAALAEPGTEVAAVESGSQLPIEHLELIAATTQVLVAGAYDGEGYLFWEPS